MAGSSGAVRYGSLQLPMAPFTGPWAPLGFALLQALCFGSPDFVANCLATLCFHSNKMELRTVTCFLSLKLYSICALLFHSSTGSFGSPA